MTPGRRGSAAWPAALVVALVLAGCATRAPLAPPAPPVELPIRVELPSVPFLPQQRDLCGPAALATVLGAAGIDADPGQLTAQVYLPQRRGSLQVEMLAAARRQGAVAVVLPARLDALLAQLAAGSPVVVLQGLPGLLAQRWHYAVAVGYDLPRGEILLRSGPDERLVLPLAEFDATWRRSDRWAMVALPPGRLAHGVGERAIVAALVAFERVADPPRARMAYEAALRRWPDNVTLHLGRGNSAYAAGDLVRAADAYAQALRLAPSFVPAHNNLALVLARLGRYEEAREEAARALALDPAWRPAVIDTLRRVDAAQTASE